ncbi:hypothetical protein DSOUD_0157 [Desulfuromonas soudanensis]|uniref:Uncharacterized protein n=1 Tax=Desulfuromonas soudanensis TaxID=1603606 RepID=A0A0M4DEX0_9BACT|nr:hypothetical protein [Desulfuromonas soudanensis]ALC14957.1 hypothetical protein DSOUD_0157 [Desulfuromonas soudanensis]
MIDSDNNEETSEQDKVRRRETSLLQRGIVTLLWALICLALVIYWYASPIMALFVVCATYMLAGYCRKRYQAHMLPSSFTTRLRRNELYQIYVVRAVRRPGTHLLLWVALIASVFTVGNWVDSLNPVLKLEEMESRTGSVVKVVTRQHVGTRKGCGDRVYLETGDGTIIQYNGLLNNDALRILSGRVTTDVTIWSRRKIKLPPCAVTNWIAQVQIGTKVVNRYDIHMSEKGRKWLLRFNIIYPVIGFLAFFGIWLTDKKVNN